jgi:lipid II:glycine glycyltransferase (peptidoglycan interpeptide bridge formation enzyme)
MTAKLTEIVERETWDGFVSNQEFAPFLQSWAWGEFQEALGSRVLRLALVESDRIAGCAQVIIGRRRLAGYAYVPYGPVLDWSNQAQVDEFMTELRKVVSGEAVDYLRIEPRIERSDEISTALRSASFRKAPGAGQFDEGWVLDLGESEETLLANMRSNTRYRIRQSAKKGVAITESTNTADLQILDELVEKTANRQQFRSHGHGYLDKQFEVLTRSGIAKLFISSLAGEHLAVAEIIDYGDTSNYAHGGSSLTSKIGAAHLLHWTAIQTAKRDGRKIYDFGGATTSTSPKHSWHGMTWFKQGFGGRMVHLVGAWDYPITRRYWLVRMSEILDKARRRGQ